MTQRMRMVKCGMGMKMRKPTRNMPEQQAAPRPVPVPLPRIMENPTRYVKFA